jgi:hypothetical protein
MCNFCNLKKNRALRFLIYCLGGLAFIAASLAFFSQSRLLSQYGSLSTVATKKITLDHIFNGTFGAEQRSLRWIPEGLSKQFFFKQCSHLLTLAHPHSWGWRILYRREWLHQAR